jgi:hypothetical protein
VQIIKDPPWVGNLFQIDFIFSLNKELTHTSSLLFLLEPLFFS